MKYEERKKLIDMMIHYSDEKFIKLMKESFTVNELCDILTINRNRYNYLKKHKKLDLELLRFKALKELEYKKDYE